MKAFIIAVATIFLLGISAYAADDHKCDYKYYRAIKKVSALSDSEMSQEDKDKWISRLRKIHQLCEDGKEEEAAEIMAELNNELKFDMVFNPSGGN